jgi:hypothetical protein
MRVAHVLLSQEELQRGPINRPFGLRGERNPTNQPPPLSGVRAACERRGTYLQGVGTSVCTPTSRKSVVPLLIE